MDYFLSTAAYSKHTLYFYRCGLFYVQHSFYILYRVVKDKCASLKTCGGVNSVHKKLKPIFEIETMRYVA